MSFQLFQELPLTFFRPLSGQFAPLYWSALRTLYALDFEGEPFEITQDTAIEQTALLIEQTSEFDQKPDQFQNEIIADATESATTSGTLTTDAHEDERAARKLSRHILKRLENCGWFDYEYRESKKGNVLNFRDYAARILHTLSQIEKQEQPVFEGLAQAIKTAVTPEALNENPGVALYNAQNATKDLVREIKILSRNMHRYPDRALKTAKTPKELLELQLDIYQSKVIDSSYHRFKTTDNVFKYRAFVLKQIENLEHSEELSLRTMDWIAQGNWINTENSSESLFQDWINLIRSKLGSIHFLTDDLDRKNARYTATTLQKISYILNQDSDLQGKLIRSLKTVTQSSDEASSLTETLFQCYKSQWFDPESLYTKPKERAALESIEVQPITLSDEQKQKALDRARKSLASQFSKKRTYEIAEALLKNKSEISLDSIPLNQVKDFMTLIFLSHHGHDKRAPYQLILPTNWKSEWSVIGPYRFHNGQLKRKGTSL